VFAEDGSNFACTTMINGFTWETRREGDGSPRLHSAPSHPATFIELSLISLVRPNFPLCYSLSFSFFLSLSRRFRPLFSTNLPAAMFLRDLSLSLFALPNWFSRQAYSSIFHRNANFEKPSALTINQVNVVQIRPSACRKHCTRRVSFIRDCVITISHWSFSRSSPPLVVILQLRLFTCDHNTSSEIISARFDHVASTAVENCRCLFGHLILKKMHFLLVGTF